MRIHYKNALISATIALCSAFGLGACADPEGLEDIEEIEDLENTGEVSLAAVVDVDLGSALAAPVYQSTTCGMVNDYTPSCATSNATDMAFTWTAPATGSYTFTTAGSSFDTLLHLRNGVGGAQLACNDDANGTLQSSVTVNLAAGQLITIVVDGYSANCGNFKLNISGSAPASPPLTSLRLWLRGDAGVTSNAGKVSSWADQSGNGYHATMATVARQPTVVSNVLNGKPVIRFGGAQSLLLAGVLQPNTFTVFVAGKNSKASETFSMIFGPGGSSANNQLRWENGSQALFVGTGNNLPIITSNIGNTRVYHALSSRYDGSTMSVYRDGNLTSTHSFVTSGPWDLYQIGAWYSSYFMEGDVAEILFYDSALSEANRTSANAYLKSKYALP